MPSRMLKMIEETLSEIMNAGIANTAIYVSKCHYEMYGKLYPNSAPIQLSSIQMYSRKFVYIIIAMAIPVDDQPCWR